MEKYSTPISELSKVLDVCIQDAYIRFVKEDGNIPNPNLLKWQEVFSKIVDVRMWLQKWPNNLCGFPSVFNGFGTRLRSEEIQTIAPTIVLKFSRNLRYIYHDGRFAYKVKGPVSVAYYDAARSRRLPGLMDTSEQSYLSNGAPLEINAKL